MTHSSLLTFLFIVLSFSNSLLAENIHKCGTMLGLQNMQEQDPTLVERMEKREQQTQNWIAQNKEVKQAAELITIPVVVHIVHSTSRPASNISDEQIYSQIQILNEDFRRTNIDVFNTPAVFEPIAADMEIEFCLATKDPNGFPTTGITRTPTSKTVFNGTNNDVKFTNEGGKDAWPTDKYLNIWVCNDINDFGINGIIGYAQFPQTGSPQTDGVVIIHTAFGNTGTVQFPYNSGRTTTHEIGHWLNLRHVWGDGPCSQDDFVEDTPLSNGPNYGCNTNLNNCNNESPDYNDMVQNYMDYSNDDCQNLFTEGQKERVRELFAFPTSARYSLIESDGCETVNVGENDVVFNEILEPFGANNCTTIEPVISFTNFGTNELIFVSIHYSINDGPVQNYTYFPISAVLSFEEVEITLPPISIPDGGIIQNLTVEFSTPNGGPDYSPENNVLEVSFATLPTGKEIPMQESFEAEEILPTDWEVSGNFRLNVTTGFDGQHSLILDNNTGTSVPNTVTIPDVDLTHAGNANLRFQTAYALQSNMSTSDVLEVLISTDCGNTYETIYTVQDNDLVSAGETTGNFIPTSNDWILHEVDLAPYAGTPNASIRFKNTQGTGNNFYLDDIHVDFPVGIASTPNAIQTTVKAYPNPALTQTKLHFESAKAGKAMIQIADKLGRIVQSKVVTTTRGDNVVEVGIDSLTAGLYLVNVKQDKVVASTKLVVIK